MSDGKYLINKSSLTGIADAVRDKLGTGGKATTDPQTGDIVYPEGKGYYLDPVTTMFIEVPDNNAYHIYPGSQIITFIRLNTEWDYLKKVEKPVSEIEVEGIFGTTATGRRFTRYIVINSNSFQLDDSNQTNIQNFKQTFDTPQTYLSISISVTNDYTREKLISWSNVKIYLRDENGNLIDLITSGFPYNGCTIGTTTSQIQKPIPYSVADIKNNIKDYWSIPDGSLEITENGTYDVTNKASAIVSVSGGLPLITVPTVKQKVLEWDTPSQCDFSSIFSTQEEMLEHLIDIIPDKGAASAKIAGKWISAPVFKDKYGRWIPLKMMGVSLPTQSFDIGKSWASLGLTETVIQNLYNNNLVFGCSTWADYADQGGHWYIIFDRYIVCCCREFIGLNTDHYSYVLYTEA